MRIMIMANHRPPLWSSSRKSNMVCPAFSHVCLVVLFYYHVLLLTLLLQVWQVVLSVSDFRKWLWPPFPNQDFAMDLGVTASLESTRDDFLRFALNKQFWFNDFVRILVHFVHNNFVAMYYTCLTLNLVQKFAIHVYPQNQVWLKYAFGNTMFLRRIGNRLFTII